MTKLKPVLGHAGRSVERVRAAMGTPRPASIRQIAEAYGREVAFEAPIVTSDGVALGGHHRLVVRRDGTWQYSGRLRATGFTSHKVSLVARLSLTPHAGDPPLVVAIASQGEVHGTNEPGDRNLVLDQSGANPLLAHQWFALRQARFGHELHHDTDIFGTAGDVAGFIFQIAAFNAALGGLGSFLVLLGKGAEALNLEQFTLPLTVGIGLASGAGFVFGPSLMFPAFVAGAAFTAATVKQRPMSADERTFADQVFRGSIPYDRVRLSNLVGIGGRPFATPGPGGAILLNLGEGYDDPRNYTRKDDNNRPVEAPGQLLIHELTHAWQIANHSFTPIYYCHALATMAGTLGGDMSAYGYGPAGPDWGDFGTEQQGSVVDEWFAGSAFPALKDVSQPQRAFAPMMEDDANPYWRYIRDHIRAGRA